MSRECLTPDVSRLTSIYRKAPGILYCPGAVIYDE